MSALAAILDFKSGGRLGSVESATKGVGIRFCKLNLEATIERDSGTLALPPPPPPLEKKALSDTAYRKLDYFSMRFLAIVQVNYEKIPTLKLSKKVPLIISYY